MEPRVFRSGPKYSRDRSRQKIRPGSGMPGILGAYLGNHAARANFSRAAHIQRAADFPRQQDHPATKHIPGVRLREAHFQQLWRPGTPWEWVGFQAPIVDHFLHVILHISTLSIVYSICNE